ncbi:uncharacterized protein LOC134719030 [Mytilus trossulus]|uniref:uncharacterized protein LOC134719030 n=1 Tax=Mytilus trossulus TaxID=6551 RepID=UPI003005BD76
MYLPKSICLLIIFITYINATKIVVSTYNLWNVMFNWEIRKLKIAKLIKSSNPDVIAFQEVRCGDSKNENQILELQKLLPAYKWAFFKCSNKVQKIKHSIKKGYNKEGIGILSKLEVLNAKAEELPYTYGPDTNKRLLIHAKLLQGDQVVNIINVHFSYDRQQQCGNAAALLDYVFRKRLKNVVLLGDFNTYNDFEAPIDLITFKPGHAMTHCKQELKQIGNRYINFDDSWQKLHGKDHSGLTFSNMPFPGLESRPDRIMVNSETEVISASLSGHGTIYKRQYKSSIVFSRFQTVLKQAALSYHSISGFSCFHDCGPHGSCRCGVCVADGNDKTCHLPNCIECNAIFYNNYFIMTCIAIFVLIHVFFAVLSILITAANFKGETISSLLGFKCCLCNPDLYTKPILLTRRSKFIKICHKWPLFRIPPCYLLFISSVSFVFVLIVIKYHFSDMIKTVNNILDEEYFPSDHLMLSVTLKYTII